MKQLPPRVILVLAGAVLVLAGMALGLAVVLRAAPAQPQGADARVPAAASQSLDNAQGGLDATGTATGAPASGGAATGTPEPFWRVQQRQAKARMAQQDRTSPTTTAGQDQYAGTYGVAPLSQLPSLPFTTPVVPKQGATRAVLSNGQTPIAGSWAGRAEELSAYLLANSPSPRFTVNPLTLAQYYVTYAGQAGVRADILWAQMLVETGFGRYGGDVSPSQNNFAGIGATGGGAAGHGFATAEAGVKAHIAHMVAYVFPTDTASWTNASADPRYNAVSPRGVARVVADLNGRWAVPGIGYGQNIERLVAGINSR